MQDNNSLPNQQPAENRPEKKYTVVITASEAAIIKQYRALQGYDEAVVMKRGGRLLMIKPTYNIMYAPQLGEQAALEMEGKEVIE